VFISGGNPHLTSWFCGVVLGPTTISKMVLEPVDFKGHLPIHAPSPKSVAWRVISAQK